MIHITRKAFEGAYHLVRNIYGYLTIGKCLMSRLVIIGIVFIVFVYILWQFPYVSQEKKLIDSNITGLNKAVFYIFPDTETLANHL